MTAALTVGSLFSGYLGLTMAVEAAFDARLAWVSDIKAYNKKGTQVGDAPLILEHRAPGVPNLGDITAVDWAAVEPVDIIDGGSPCQDISTAGRRAGMTTGTRSNLWVAMRDGVPHLRALGRVLGDLASLGFDAEWRSLRAADIGAPHGRYRVFVVAAHPERVARLQRRLPAPGETTSGRALGTTPRGDRALVDLLPTPTAARYGSNRSASPGAQVRPSLHNIGDLLHTPRAADKDATPGSPAAARHVRAGNGSLAEVLGVHLLPTPKTTDNRAHSAADMTRHDPGLRAIASLLPTPTTQPGTGNGHARTLTAELLLTPRATDGTQGGPNQRGSSGDLMLPSATQDMGRYTAAITRWGTALGRPAPAALIPGTTRLNPRFVEWMMGLPAGWVTDIPGLTRNQQLHALGNGVVPQQAHAAILDCLTAPTERPAT